MGGDDEILSRLGWRKRFWREMGLLFSLRNLLMIEFPSQPFDL